MIYRSLLLLTLFGTSCGFIRAEDWPQWRGAERDGHVSRLPESLAGLKLVWREKVAGACDAGISVADGLLVMADHDDQNDYYVARAAADGREVWKRTFPNGREMDYGAGPRATPLVYQGRVYVQSAFGDLDCLEHKTGKTVWHKNYLDDLGGGKVPRWGYCGSPLVASDKLIVAPGGKASLVALEPKTGRVLWQSGPGQPNYSSPIIGVFGGVEQVVGYDAKSLGGWELASGKRLWMVEIDSSGGYVVPTPLKVGEALFVADSTNWAQIYAFDPGGVIRQPAIAKSEDLAPAVPTPTAAGPLILGQAEKLVCLDAVDGLKTLWLDEEEKAFQSDCHLLVAGNRGLAMNSEGVLVLFRFDRTGVKVLGQQTVCQKTLMHPTLVDGRFYVRDAESVFCYELGGR